MKKTKKILALVLIAIMLILQFGGLSFVTQVQAADETTGSIQIFKYGMKDLSGATTPGTGETMEVPTGSEPLEGVEFTIYKVSDTYTDVSTIPTDSTFTTTGTTDENGMVKFSSLELGRYLVVESNTIDSVSSKSDNFLVDIPMTNADGSGLIYDIKVYPKNQLVIGDVTLNAYNSKTSEKVDGAEYVLNIWDETQNKYVPYLNNGTEVKTETVDGKFVIDGLTIGKYCFIGTRSSNRISIG